MTIRRYLVGQLLAYAATAAERRDDLAHWQLREVGPREFQWVLQGGLGPLLDHATRHCPELVPVEWRERLHGETLTARMRHAERIDVVCQVIGLCAGQGVPVTLLKGISTSEQFYPAGHLRPMADVDVLVPPAECHRVETMLKATGYRAAEDFPDATEQHHGPPLRHPMHDIWIEIHRSLFPARDEFSFPPVFSGTSVAENSEATSFHGVRALRLAPEVQLIYIASSWMRDLMLSGIHPSFLASIFDAIFLVDPAEAAFDWSKLLSLTGDDMPSASLYVLTSYLALRGLIDLPADVEKILARLQHVVGPVQLRTIHAVVDRHLIGARPWPYPVPLPVAGRYGIRRQWNKRVLGRP